MAFNDPVHENTSPFALSFGDRTPRVHTHVLVIPAGQHCPIEAKMRKCKDASHSKAEAPFVQFWDLIASGNEQRIKAFFRTIHATAAKAHERRKPLPWESPNNKRDLVKYGYRVVMNSYGASENINHAKQTVPHLHAHIGGGECLAPVTKKHETLLSYPKRTETLVETIQLPERISIPIFRVEETEHQPAEFIFEVLRDGKPVFDSVHDFAGKASGALLKRLGEEVIRVARENDFIGSGFRIYSNHGHDAHRGTEQHFRLHVAYGSYLSSTLSNRRGDTEDYANLPDYAHQHCEP